MGCGGGGGCSKSLLTGTIGSNFMLLVHKGDLHINED